MRLLTKLKTLKLTGFFLLLGCGQPANDSSVPSGILAKHEFAVVLRDFSLAESAANMNIKDAPVFKIDSVYAFDPLKDNNVTRAQFDSSVAYYCRFPEKYKEVYEEVLRMLGEMKKY
jgi:hypothetical protein